MCGKFHILKPRKNNNCAQICCGKIENGKCTEPILFLNALASGLHFILFVTLLCVRFGAFSDIKLMSRKLLQSITVWEKFDSTNGKSCADTANCFKTAEAEFLIFSKQVDNGYLTLEYLLLSFSALSFIFQGIRPWIGLVVNDNGTSDERTYLDEVKSRINWLRWIEYSFSATCMILAIGFVVDPNIEFSTVLMTSTSTAATQLCGLVGELMLEMNPPEKGKTIGTLKTESNLLAAWIIHFTGWILQIGVFASLFNAFFKSASYGNDNSNAVEPPEFVYLIVVMEAILFASFGITQFFDFLDRSGSGCCRDKGDRFEYVFVGLSLTAKFFLSITIAANLWISPDSNLN